MQMEEDKRDLERQLRETKANAEAREKKLSEQRQVEERKHMEEIDFLTKTNQQLKVSSSLGQPMSIEGTLSDVLGSTGRLNCAKEITKEQCLFLSA